MQVCLQLPTDRVEALLVLGYAEELLRGFLAGGEVGVVLPLRATAALDRLAARSGPAGG